MHKLSKQRDKTEFIAFVESRRAIDDCEQQNMCRDHRQFLEHSPIIPVNMHRLTVSLQLCIETIKISGAMRQ